jgi:hypothetical protein
MTARVYFKPKGRQGVVSFDSVPITGNITDYCCACVAGQPSFIVELSVKGDVKEKEAMTSQPEDQIELIFKENLGPALALINSAGFSQPAGTMKICADDSTRTVQVVQNYWEVFKGWGMCWPIISGQVYSRENVAHNRVGSQPAVREIRLNTGL